jgi:hypothetical protein
MMKQPTPRGREDASLLDVVALLTDRPDDGLARGQVGTIVELLDDKTMLVEFSDDEGRAYAVVPCVLSSLLVLRHLPERAA